MVDPHNGQNTANSGRIVWVCLTILWGWPWKGLVPSVTFLSASGDSQESKALSKIDFFLNIFDFQMHNTTPVFLEMIMA